MSRNETGTSIYECFYFILDNDIALKTNIFLYSDKNHHLAPLSQKNNNLPCEVMYCYNRISKSRITFKFMLVTLSTKTNINRSTLCFNFSICSNWMWREPSNVPKYVNVDISTLTWVVWQSKNWLFGLASVDMEATACMSRAHRESKSWRVCDTHAKLDMMRCCVALLSRRAWHYKHRETLASFLFVFEVYTVPPVICRVTFKKFLSNIDRLYLFTFSSINY